jgi:beta-glucosidase
MLADGSFEQLEQSIGNDPNACGIEKMDFDLLEGYTPNARLRPSYQLWKEPYKENASILQDVAEGKVTMDAFVGQMTDEELAYLLGGQPNTGVANTFGFGNMPEYGVANIMTADGPAGLRIAPECGIHTTAWPCATLLACTWDEEIVYAVGQAGAKEVKENNIAVWLTPAINIHRSPLCGRNFEYYSEDPFLTGKLASAMVRGIQSQHIGASVKHFAINNKETNRKNSDSRVSERAAREIYLKAFEIIVKEADPWTIMSSYNIINGHRASENRDLLEDILRDEWGFKGMVTTDWWTCGEHYKEVKAGNDVKMACGYPQRLLKAIEEGLMTREDMEICAKRILSLILKVD